MSSGDTLPKNLAAGFHKYGDGKVAMRQKDLTWIGEDQAEAIAEFLIHVGATGE